MNGPNPLQPRAIMDWCKITGNTLHRNEIAVVMEMDTAYIVAWRKETATTAPPPNS